MSTLIVPCAGKSTRFPSMRPKWLLTHPEGKIMLEKAIEGFDLTLYKSVIFTIVKKHVDDYEAEIILKQIFTDKKFKILILDEFTNSPSQTVALTLEKMEIKGPFVVKDSDNYVSFTHINESNFVVGFDIHNHSTVQNLRAKSFLMSNEQDIITNIIEKQIVSNIISVGIYGFDSPQVFLNAYKALYSLNNKMELYISHIIAYIIGTNMKVYKICKADKYQDWGTFEEWADTQAQHATYIVDLDGVMFVNCGQYGINRWENNITPIKNNVDVLRKKYDLGASIIFMSARSEVLRDSIDKVLNDMGFKKYQLILGCNHGPRVLINDFAPTNKYPSAEAINIPRNGLLEDYL